MGQGLQFGLQFTPVQPSSPGYTRPARPAARTPMNPREHAPLKFLIRGLGLRVPGGAPMNTLARGIAGAVGRHHSCKNRGHTGEGGCPEFR
jgi:hypothetical protein